MKNKIYCFVFAPVISIALHACDTGSRELKQSNSSLASAQTLQTCDLLPLPAAKDLTVPLLDRQKATSEEALTLDYFSLGATGAVYRDKQSAFVYKFPFRTVELTEQALSSQDSQIRNMIERSRESYQYELELHIQFKKNTTSGVIDGDGAKALSSYIVPAQLVTIQYGGEVIEGLKKPFVDGRPLAEYSQEQIRGDPRLFGLTKDLFDAYKKAVLEEGYGIRDLHGNNILYDANKGSLRIIDGDFEGKIDEWGSQIITTIETYRFNSFCEAQSWCSIHNVP